ncbi:hypothetical protein IAT38_004353 [Cryptococcus sp. DSM 104549]
MGKLSEFLASSSEKKEAPPPPSYGEAKQSPAFASSSATPYQAPPSFPHYFACLHLARTDRIRLIGLPPEVHPAVEEAIRRVWIPGVQQQGALPAAYEWKLRGNPWSGQYSEAIPARRLLCHVFHALSACGWDAHMACDLSKKGWDKDSIILHTVQPQQKYYFAISFNMGDKIRIIDPPDDRTAEAFKGAVRTWSGGIQNERMKEPGCYQFKLRGNPWWSSDGTEITYSRLLCCTILSAMESCGFELVASVDMSVAAGDGQGDLDTWFFATKMR